MAGQVLAGEAAAKAGANDTVGIGIVGVGTRGTVLLQNLLQIPGVEIRAVCDIDESHLLRGQATVSDKHQKRPRATADWKQMLTFDGIDAVVAAIPCDLHAKLYLDVIAAGKDLYGEKPMCLTTADLDAVVKAARVQADRSDRPSTPR